MAFLWTLRCVFWLHALAPTNYISITFFRLFSVRVVYLLTFHVTEFPTGRFLRDARLYAVGAGTQEIRRMLIGREFNANFDA